MSDISSLAASLTSAIEKEAKELSERKAQLEKEKERLAEERRRMSSFAAVGTDLVKVNVGGKVFQTHRATLLSAEGSLLEAVFSGRWEESLVRDDAGLVFFDFDPACFRLLLNYLRTRSLAEPGGQVVPQPHVPPEHKAQFEAMVSFMGLQEMVSTKTLAMPEAVPEEAMAMMQAGSVDGSIAVQGGRLQKIGTSSHRSAVGAAALLQAGTQQKVAWKVSVLQCSRGVLAGVTANAAPPDNSYGDAGTFGWGSGGVYSAGGQTPAAGWPGWQAGDVAIFQLDATQQILRMHLRRTEQVYTLPLPAEAVVQSARLHFSLQGPGDSVEVAQVTSQELADGLLKAMQFDTFRTDSF